MSQLLAITLSETDRQIGRSPKLSHSLSLPLQSVRSGLAFTRDRKKDRQADKHVGRQQSRYFFPSFLCMKEGGRGVVQ